LPGFVDMHGHIGGRAQGADPDYVFKLWMAHGITTIRQPSGMGTERILDLKKKSLKNEIIAPRILAYTGFNSRVKSPEEAREWVRENAKKGADGIKFFGAPPEIMQVALEENKKIRTWLCMSSRTIRCCKMECTKFCKSRTYNNGTLVWIARSFI